MRPTIRVATHDRETVEAIHAALDQRRPIALLHAKLPAHELARQRAAIEQATFADGDAIILFTSGSTASPRGVVHTRASIDAAAHASWEHLGRRESDRWACILPMAHAGGASIVVRCRAAGIAIDLELSPAATLLSLVPAQLAALEPSPSLRALLLGGAAASPDLVTAAVGRGIPVFPTYGLTETFGQIATARVAGGPLVPLPGVELEGGTRARPDRLRVRGPMLAARYLDGERIAPELVTADLGFLEDGILHVIGRADDVVISGGENVHPAQVESVLAATHGVREAVAFGVPDDQWGQIVAVVIAVDDTFVVDAALASWHAQLPPHARPRRLASVRELPRLPSGKLDRRAVATTPTAAIDYTATVLQHRRQ